jgi:hypothetical protein
MVTKANAFVLKMSLLGMIDNLGGGLVSPLISYWFFCATALSSSLSALCSFYLTFSPPCRF